MLSSFHIVVAMKPIEGNFAQNAIEHGVAGLNIDACRIEGEAVPINKLIHWSGFGQEKRPAYQQETNNKGRFPANLIVENCEAVIDLFPTTTSGMLNQASVVAENRIYGKHDGYPEPKQYEKNSGSAARFFKQVKTEREIL